MRATTSVSRITKRRSSRTPCESGPAAALPKHVNVFGYFYDIDTGKLSEVVRYKAQAGV